MKSAKTGNLLIVYSAHSTYTATVKEYLEAFQNFGNMNVYFMDGTSRSRGKFDLQFFDAVLVTYSVRLSHKDYINPRLAKKLASFKGPKALTIQDEYDNTEQARKWIEYLGFDLVFTCVPDQYIENIYPQKRFPKVRFLNVLTGYVPDRLVGLNRIPLKDRKLSIVYRGRPLHPVYGFLGYEKLHIGQRAAAECVKRAIACDIAWGEKDRIYGDGWYDFLSSGRATLGTESGANVFDFDGSLVKKVNRLLADEPRLDFLSIHERLLSKVEGRDAVMNQISPKIFEAIALGTALILFEGEYSKILTPHMHYIPLKKDFSNIDEVFASLNNLTSLQQMADTAYHDIVESRRYSYVEFVRNVEEELIARIKRPLHPAPVMLAIFSNPEQSRLNPGPVQGLATNRPLFPEEGAYLRRASLVLPVLADLMFILKTAVRMPVSLCKRIFRNSLAGS